MSNSPTMPNRPRAAMRVIIYSITAAGAAASLFGFYQAYTWLLRSVEAVVGIILVTIGLLAAAYGFVQAFRAIRVWQVVVVTPWIAFLVIVGGLVSSGYGFLWAFRGLGDVSDATSRIAGYVLVGVAGLAALFGFYKAYVTVREQARQRKTLS